MNLKKLIASSLLCTSLIGSPIRAKAEEQKYFFESSFGEYFWSSEGFADVFDKTFLIKAGIGAKFNEHLFGKFSVGYTGGKEKRVINGVSGENALSVTCFEATLNYFIPFLDDGKLSFGGGFSAMTLRDKVTISSGQTALEADSALGVLLNTEIGVPFPKNEKVYSTFNFGINLSPFEGIDVSGTYLNVGLMFGF